MPASYVEPSVPILSLIQPSNKTDKVFAPLISSLKSVDSILNGPALAAPAAPAPVDSADSFMMGGKSIAKKKAKAPKGGVDRVPTHYELDITRNITICMAITQSIKDKVIRMKTTPISIPATVPSNTSATDTIIVDPVLPPTNTYTNSSMNSSALFGGRRRRRTHRRRRS